MGGTTHIALEPAAEGQHAQPKEKPEGGEKPRQYERLARMSRVNPRRQVRQVIVQLVNVLDVAPRAGGSGSPDIQRVYSRGPVPGEALGQGMHGSAASSRAMQQQDHFACL